MAIYLYYGKIGDGKTYHVIKNEIIPAARKGRKIYANIDGLSDRRLMHYVGREVNLVQWSGVEEVRAALQVDQDDRDGLSLKVDRGSLLVVDEAQMCFDSRAWKDTGPAVLRFFEYHRHWGLDVVLITQSPGRLDKALVRLANEALHVKNLRFLGSWAGRRYVINVRQTPYDRECMATMSGRYETEIFGLYRSATLNVKARVSKAAMSRTWLLIPAVVAVVVVLSIRSGGLNVLHAKAGKVVVSKDEVASVAPVVSIPAVDSVSAPAVGSSQDAQPERVEEKIKAVLKGSLDRDGVRIYYLLLDDGQVRESQTLDGYELVGKL